MPDISIIIVNWNTRALLLDCLQSVARTQANLELEVLVVDNASTDGSAEAVRHNFPYVTLIANSENVGFAPANNQAIRISRGRYMLLLNSDTVVHDGALQKLFAFMEQRPDVGVVGAALLNGDGSPQLSYAKFPTVWSEVLGQNVRERRWLAENAYAADWVGGACLLIRRSVVDQIGLLDEHFFMYSEETDWCYRAKQAGWQIAYLLDACVTHFGGQSSRQNNVEMFVALNKSKLYFFQKHYGSTRANILRFALMGATFAKLALIWPLSRLGLAGRRDVSRQQALLTALRTLPV